MLPKRALIIRTTALLWSSGRLSSWHVAPEMRALLRDFEVKGWRLVVVADRVVEGRSLTNVQDESISEALKQALRPDGEGRPPVVTFIEEKTDPHPLWNMARRCSLRLENSVFIGSESTDPILAENAGVGRYEHVEHFFGPLGIYERSVA